MTHIAALDCRDKECIDNIREIEKNGSHYNQIVLIDFIDKIQNGIDKCDSCPYTDNCVDDIRNRISLLLYKHS